MALRTIITVPNEVLKTRARKVTEFGEELHTLIEDMVDTMREAPGVGLAAPQVNVLQRVIVVEYGDDEDDSIEPKLYVLVNPEISRFSKTTLIGLEGCLSIPNYLGDVERAEAITVKAQNRSGKTIKLKAKGWLARIIQHEVDHLDGILFTDRALKIFSKEEIEALSLQEEYAAEA